MVSRGLWLLAKGTVAEEKKQTILGYLPEIHGTPPCPLHSDTNPVPCAESINSTPFVPDAGGII